MAKPRQAARVRLPSLKLIPALSVAGAAGVSVWLWRCASRERHRLLKSGSIQPLQSAWYFVRGLRIHARIANAHTGNDRDNVVLIHGLGVSSSYFVPAAECLATQFAIFAPDLPGHGLSESLSRALNVQDLAEVALDWMRVAGLERASLVGHSMGCQIAVEMALRNPDRISRLVLIAPTPDPRARNVAAQLRRFLLDVFYERPSLTLIVLKDYVRMGTRFVSEFYAMLFHPMEKKLRDVTVPTLLARGENDPVVPQRWLEEAALLLGTDGVVVIPRWGHAVQYSAAPQLTRAIEPFLAAHLASGVRQA